MDCGKLSHQYKNLLSSYIYELHFVLLASGMETTIKSRHFNVLLSVTMTILFLFRLLEDNKSMSKDQHVYSFQ